MSDPQPPPIPPEHQPLEYWHATGPPPLHPVLLAMILVTGMVVGAVAATIVGGFVVGAIFSIGSSNRMNITLATVGVLFIAAICYITMLARKLNRERTMSLEARRRGSRFFQIGLLLGCALACLLGGICFGAMR